MVGPGLIEHILLKQTSVMNIYNALFFFKVNLDKFRVTVL